MFDRIHCHFNNVTHHCLVFHMNTHTHTHTHWCSLIQHSLRCSRQLTRTTGTVGGAEGIWLPQETTNIPKKVWTIHSTLPTLSLRTLITMAGWLCAQEVFVGDISFLSTHGQVLEPSGELL